MSMDVHAMATIADRKRLAAETERVRRVAEGLSRKSPVASGPLTRLQVLASVLQRSAGHQFQAWRQAWRQVQSEAAEPMVVPDENRA